MEYIELKNFSHTAAADGRRMEFNFKNRSVVSEGVSPDIVFIGDSITHMWELQAYFRGLGKYIINRGIGGDVSGFLLRRIRADALALSPKQVVLLIGINDLNQAMGDVWWREKGRDLGELLDEYRSNMKLIAENCAAAGARTALCSLLPVSYPEIFNGSAIKDAVLEANVFLKELAARFGFEFVDYHSAMCGEDGKTLRKGLAQDGLHPNAEGYRIMADVLMPLLK